MINNSKGRERKRGQEKEKKYSTGVLDWRLVYGNAMRESVCVKMVAYAWGGSSYGGSMCVFDAFDYVPVRSPPLCLNLALHCGGGSWSFMKVLMKDCHMM